MLKKKIKSDSMNSFINIQKKTEVNKYYWRQSILMKLYFMVNMNKYFLIRKDMDNYLRRYIGRLILNSNLILDNKLYQLDDDFSDLIEFLDFFSVYIGLKKFIGTNIIRFICFDDRLLDKRKHLLSPYDNLRLLDNKCKKNNKLKTLYNISKNVIEKYNSKMQLYNNPRDTLNNWFNNITKRIFNKYKLYHDEMFLIIRSMFNEIIINDISIQKICYISHILFVFNNNEYINSTSSNFNYANNIPILYFDKALDDKFIFIKYFLKYYCRIKELRDTNLDVLSELEEIKSQFNLFFDILNDVIPFSRLVNEIYIGNSYFKNNWMYTIKIIKGLINFFDIYSKNGVIDNWIKEHDKILN